MSDRAVWDGALWLSGMSQGRKGSRRDRQQPLGLRSGSLDRMDRTSVLMTAAVWRRRQEGEAVGGESRPGDFACKSRASTPPVTIATRPSASIRELPSSDL